MNSEKQIITAAGRRQSLRELKQYRFVFERMLKRDIKSVAGSTIGDYLTLLLKPLFLAAIIGILKSRLSHQPILLSYVTAYYGLLLWWIFADNAKASISIFKRNRPIITKIYIPKAIFVLSMFGSRLYGVTLQLAVGLIFLAFMNLQFSVGSCIIFFFTCLAVSIFSINVCLGISVLAPKYRAIRTLAEFMLFSLFFTMPVTFNVEILGGYLEPYFLINPIGSAIAIVKNEIAGGMLDYTTPALSICGWGLVSFIFVYYFSRNVESTVEEI